MSYKTKSESLLSAIWLDKAGKQGYKETHCQQLDLSLFYE